jgi:hypothetical protein
LRIAVAGAVLTPAGGVVLSLIFFFARWAIDGFEHLSPFWILVIAAFAFYVGLVYGAIAALPVALLLAGVVLALRPYRSPPAIARILRTVVLVLACLGAAGVFVHHLWTKSDGLELIAIGVLPGVAAVVLTWIGARAITVDLDAVVRVDYRAEQESLLH